MTFWDDFHPTLIESLVHWGSKGEGPGSNFGVTYRTNEKSTTEEIPSSGLKLEVPLDRGKLKTRSSTKGPNVEQNWGSTAEVVNQENQVRGDNWTESETQKIVSTSTQDTLACVRTRRPVTLQAYLESLGPKKIHALTLKFKVEVGPKFSCSRSLSGRFSSLVIKVKSDIFGTLNL